MESEGYITARAHRNMRTVTTDISSVRPSAIEINKYVPSECYSI